jgi:molybdopterin molybdotransferase
MISVETARETILSTLKPLPAESVSLSNGLGRVSATDVLSAVSIPAFDNAAVDGYAVQSQDLAIASASTRIHLKVAATVAAGEIPAGSLQPGSCMRIFTGASLPPGADAVVMQEDVATGNDGTVQFQERVTPWEGVRMTGEDVRPGSLLIAAGEQIRPAHIGLLTASGHREISVHRRPRLALLTTGSELTEPGEPLAPGRIYDSNGALLPALAASDGFVIHHQGRMTDDLEGTTTALREAVHNSDLVITTGGVSVGTLDVVKEAVRALDGTIEVWKIAMKPGKPFAWGRVGAAHWFGLPGNPVSAFVAWWIFVRPALRRLTGMRAVVGRKLPAVLGEPIENRGDRRHFLRVTLDEAGTVRLAGPQGSHIQSGLANADALLDVPPHTSWEAGRAVSLELLN